MDVEASNALGIENPETLEQLQVLVGGLQPVADGSRLKVHGLIGLGAIIQVNGGGQRMLQLSDPSPVGEEAFHGGRDYFRRVARGEEPDAIVERGGVLFLTDETKEKMSAFFATLESIPVFEDISSHAGHETR